MVFFFFSIDAPTEMPKYKFPEAQSTVEPSETSNQSAGPNDPQDQDINRLRVNLFSRWGDDAARNADISIDRNERNRDSIVNYSTGDMSSEVEMLDSSTAHIEY